MAHAARGEADAAFEWLEKCHVQRDPGLVLLGPAPQFSPLRPDRRWRIFMKKIGLAELEVA